MLSESKKPSYDGVVNSQWIATKSAEVKNINGIEETVLESMESHEELKINLIAEPKSVIEHITIQKIRSCYLKFEVTISDQIVNTTDASKAFSLFET